MSFAHDWLTDDEADALLAEQRPHPTIPADKLRQLKVALDDALSTTRAHLKAARRLRSHGGTFEHLYHRWRQRHELLLFVLTLYHDAHLRCVDINLADCWTRIEAVRSHFIGRQPPRRRLLRVVA